MRACLGKDMAPVEGPGPLPSARSHARRDWCSSGLQAERVSSPGVQVFQEQPAAFNAALLDFMRSCLRSKDHL